MKCPLMTLATLANSDTGTDFYGDADDCIGKNCAWWLPEAEMCAMKALGMQAWSRGEDAAVERARRDREVDDYEDRH